MSKHFLPSGNINKEFIDSVKSELMIVDISKYSPDDMQILHKIKKDLEDQVACAQLRPDKFVIYENEYNFLSQNDKIKWIDYLLFRYKFKIYPVNKCVSKFPLHILIELSSYCNLRCAKCFQTDDTFSRSYHMGYMDIEILKDIVRQSEEGGTKAITLASRGEPLLHPEFGKAIDCIKGNLFDLKINTNAMLLDEKKIHSILNSNVTELVFSVDATDKYSYEKTAVNGNFEKVLNNIQKFHKIRKREYPKSTCKTRINGVKYDKEFDEVHFVNFWKEKVDNVVCVDIVKNLWDGYHNPTKNQTNPCSLLWQRIYIWFDGTVNPCDYDYKSLLNLGNVKKNSIHEIWQGERFNKMRQDHLSGLRCQYIPCDRCERKEC
jgi:radical SAM protein with 4Fe4S-binding SPASM domain